MTFQAARAAVVDYLQREAPEVIVDTPDCLPTLRRVVTNVRRLGIVDEADCLDLLNSYYVRWKVGGGFPEAIDFGAIARGVFTRPTSTGSNVAAPTAGKGPARPIDPTPFVLCDPRSIPPRDVLYGQHYVREMLSMTVAPGGVGKSAHVVSEVLAMATGRPLLGATPVRPLRVWLWNGEDPVDEIRRRVLAAAMHFGLDGAALGGRLFTDSGRDTPIKIVETDGRNAQVVAPRVDELVEVLRRRQIDVLVVDPFVTTHDVPENDNGAMNKVADAWRDVAKRAGCAVELVHHSRKDARLNGEELGVAQARGASALIDAVRSARFLLPMTKTEAAQRGLSQWAQIYRVEVGKANLAPRPDDASWFRRESVALGNATADHPAGDHIGVAARWTPPDMLAQLRDGVLDTVVERLAALGDDDAGRLNEQSPDWAGYLVAEVMDLDVGPSKACDRTTEQNADRGRVRGLIHQWTRAGGPLKGVAVRDRGKGRPTPVLRPERYSPTAAGEA